MNVLVNATSARLGGGITVLQHLLPALAAQDEGAHRYTVVARKEVLPRLDPSHERIRFVTPALDGGIARRLLWEQIALPLQGLRASADVLFSPAGIAAFASRAPQVLLLQNAAPFDADVVARIDDARRARLLFLRRLTILSAHRARRVVFLSEHARAQILPQLGIPESRTACVPLGRDPSFTPEAAERAPEVLARYGINPPYILSVSQFYHYKNLAELVIGYAHARPALPEGTTLVLAGDEQEPETAADVRRAAQREGVDEQVKFLGSVPSGDLAPLYAAAALFAFPSTCESFPNILVEALSCGVPTLCSRVGPMREIAGDAAWYFDPFDPDHIAAALIRGFQDEPGAAVLRNAGPWRAARYSWAATARALLVQLEKAAA